MSLDPGPRWDDREFLGWSLDPDIQQRARTQEALRRFGRQGGGDALGRRGLSRLSRGGLGLAHRGLKEGLLRSGGRRPLRGLQRALTGQVRAERVHEASGAIMVNEPLQARRAASRNG